MFAGANKPKCKDQSQNYKLSFKLIYYKKEKQTNKKTDMALNRKKL